MNRHPQSLVSNKIIRKAEAKGKHVNYSCHRPGHCRVTLCDVTRRPTMSLRENWHNDHWHNFCASILIFALT